MEQAAYEGQYIVDKIVRQTRKQKTRKLSLRYFDLEDIAIPDIVKVVRSRRAKIECLDLFRNRITDEGFVGLAEAIGNNKWLKTLTLSCNKLGDRAVKDLVGALHDQPIATLDLGFNNIGNLGAEYIGCFLEKNKSLTGLRLAGNQIGDGIKDIAKALTVNENLLELNLYYNQFQDFQSLAEALEVNRKLEKLLLSGNYQANVNSVNAFCRALGVNKNLKSLVMHNCSLRDPQAAILASVLVGNFTLQSLDLRENKITKAGLVELAKALAVNEGLRSLGIWSNSFSLKDEDSLWREQFCEYLSRNYTLVAFPYDPTTEGRWHEVENIILRNLDKNNNTKSARFV